MAKLYIFDPTSSDKLSSFRGGGRIIQILKENLPAGRHGLPEAIFTNNLQLITKNYPLLVPFWKPFEKPILEKKIADKQYLMIYDCIPLKYSSHFPAGLRGNLNLLRNKRSLKYFDKIITISNHSKSDIINYLNVPAKKVEVIYPALSKAFFSNPAESAGTNSDQFQLIPTKYIIYVGDVNWNKNLVNLARAIKLADISCVFVGKPFQDLGFTIDDLRIDHPWLKEYKEFLRLAKGDKRFIFAGFVTDHELINLYQKAVCNILVSRDEGFGFSYLEAASQNCPSILSDIAICHETAADTALFANSQDSNDIAEKIKTIFSDKKLRNELGEKAFKRTTSNFSPNNFKKHLEQI